MIGTDLTEALHYVITEVGKCVYQRETGYVLDATYFKTRYYEKKVRVRDTEGNMVGQKVKNAKVYFLRGLDTGIPVVAAVEDYNVNDQTVFVALLKN